MTRRAIAGPLELRRWSRPSHRERSVLRVPADPVSGNSCQHRIRAHEPHRWQRVRLAIVRLGSPLVTCRGELVPDHGTELILMFWCESAVITVESGRGVELHLSVEIWSR